MSSSLNKDIQTHVKDKCATYAGNGRCLLDRPCPFFSGDESARCLYFENSVLPEDDKLEARYWSRFGLSYWRDSIKTCENCGKGYTPNSNRQKYCDDCKTHVKTMQKRKENRRRYQRNKDK